MLTKHDDLNQKSDSFTKGAVDAIRKRISALFCSDELMNSLLPLGETLSGAKFSRALLLLKIAVDNGISLEQATEAAIGVELLHMATLCHDDVIDDSEVRRQGPSLKASLGNKKAILCGDHLFALAMRQVQQTQSPACLASFMNRVLETCRGESIQDLAVSEGKILASEDQLFEVSLGKTGALFAFCTEAPMLMDKSYRPEIVETMARIGLNSGLAFQLTDDLLDLLSTQEIMGKPVGDDIQKNILTYPLICLMHELGMDWSAFSQRFSAHPKNLQLAYVESSTYHHVFSKLKDLHASVINDMDSLNEIKVFSTMNFFWQKYIFLRLHQSGHSFDSTIFAQDGISS